MYVRRGFSISWCVQTVFTGRRKIQCILEYVSSHSRNAKVLEDKMLELKLLKPPDDQTTNNKEGLNISRTIDTMQDAV